MLLLFTLWLLGSPQLAVTDPVQTGPAASKAVNRTTATTCGLYSAASTQSPMLSIIGTGAQVQVLDSSNAYFVRAQLTKDGKTITGYMYRACLGSAK